MDFVIIPFHDWRKSEKEGFRTRDVHFINALAGNSFSNRILVINRPITKLELIYKKHQTKLDGKVLLKMGKFSLTEVRNNVYVADYHSIDILGQVVYRFNWFIDKYNDISYRNFIEICLGYLKFNKVTLLNQNVFAFKLAVSLNAEFKIFDAWDNFLKFPGYSNIREKLFGGYEELSCKMDKWITNSNENIEFYRNTFGVNEIMLLKNGVKTNFGQDAVIVPEDLKNIKKPWIGFGGKISYLIDYELINFITEDNPESSFVFVGQILDHSVYNKIVKRKNIFFLGDKKYDIYANYVKSFDICIIPYQINDKQHGGDSMKAYEYLIAKKKVVGTNGNGLEDLNDFIYVTKSKEEFSKELKSSNNSKINLPIEKHTWDSKAREILCLVKE